MRIKELDGLRGISILLVVFYHFFSRWPEIYPYKNQFADFFLFKYGSFGVELFFMISGLVIFMTLDKTENFIVFVKKRWLRLFPSMLIVSLFVISTSFFFPHRPIGEPKLVDLIPGLTFLEPYWLEKIFHFPFKSLEGAFWSLYVEFRFYFLFGFCFYFLGRKKAIKVLALITLLSFLLTFLTSSKVLEFLFLDVLLGRYLFWFLIGIYAYEFLNGKIKEYLFEVLGLALLGAIYSISKQSFSVQLIQVLCLLLFLGLLKIEFLKKIIGNSFFVFMGAISYPLYLVHENAGVSLIISFQEYLTFIPSFFYPFLSLGILSFLAWVEAFKFSPKLSKSLKKVLGL